MIVDAQDWTEREFCESYAETWDISTHDVHYGWLAPGEGTLNLMHDVRVKGANVLDIGCGMGQNLVALARRGAHCFGIDISPFMLDSAVEVAERSGLASEIEFCRDDMRTLSAYPDIGFDLILSVYSLEYVRGLQEFRKVIYNLYRRLNPGGALIFCFSHPSQMPGAHARLTNNTVQIGSGRFSTCCYSFCDVIQILRDTGFQLERIVEQHTLNPSRLTYEEGKQFPYHFHDDKNPCTRSMDDFSNSYPHTIIYKARKPLIEVPTRPQQRAKELGFRIIWGQRRRVVRHESFSHLGRTFHIEFLSQVDNVQAICEVARFRVSSTLSVKSGETLELYPENMPMFRAVPAHGLLGILERHLANRNLTPIYRAYDLSEDTSVRDIHLLIDRVDGVHDKFRRIVGIADVGLLVFVNRQEPSQGKLSIDDIELKEGDLVELLYVAFGSTTRTIELDDIVQFPLDF